MTSEVASFADRALLLPSEDRVYLVDRLLESLNASGTEEIDRLWAEEVEQRIDDLDSGKVQAIPGVQVFSELRDRLGK